MSKQQIIRALLEARSRIEAAGTNNSEQHPALTMVLDAITAATEETSLANPSMATVAMSDEQAKHRQRIAELEEAVAARDEFIATIGHELRNPLSPILLHAQYLLHTVEKRPDEPVSRSWLVPQLQIQIQRIHRFVGVLNRILDVSRISAGTISLELEDVELGEVVRGVCADFERELALSGSELHVSNTGLMRGRWDRTRLEQICTNLISNAIRYGDGKPIDIHIAGDSDTATLTIRDNGIGIAEEEQERIFYRMERVGDTRRTGGLGIGLWIVQNLCIALGGSVRVNSQLGAGSMFIVSLPRRAATGL